MKNIFSLEHPKRPSMFYETNETYPEGILNAFGGIMKEKLIDAATNLITNDQLGFASEIIEPVQQITVNGCVYELSVSIKFLRKVERETGYYWCKMGGPWFTAKWDDELKEWWIPLGGLPYYDRHMTEINEVRIKNPDEK